MSDPRPMNPPKPNRRKPGANKLEPIDWHEYANDAVLNGNMSTLFHRPPTEDPSAYASPEALVEIEKRAKVGHALACPPTPTAGAEPVEGSLPAEGASPTVGAGPAAVPEPGSGLTDDEKRSSIPLERSSVPLGVEKSKKVKPIRDVHDALTLAGRILYKAMYGPMEGTEARHCAKGYRQLAAETHLDKDTVRDLIAEFKDKGIVREIATYDPDTRSSKTYEVQSNQAMLEKWREAGLLFVTSGRQRPEFCTAQGQPAPPRLRKTPDSGFKNKSY
jgi:hypothetical protein